MVDEETAPNGPRGGSGAPRGDIETPSASVAVERGQYVTPETVRGLIERAVQQTWEACHGPQRIEEGKDGRDVFRMPWSKDLGQPEVRMSVAADGSTHFVILPRLVWQESDARMADGRELRMRVGDETRPLGAVPPAPAADPEEE